MKKERRNHGKNIMSAPAMQGGHKQIWFVLQYTIDTDPVMIVQFQK